jgi:hypothetical protein
MLSNECHHFGSSLELTQKGIHYFVFQGLTLVKSGLTVVQGATLAK